MKTEDNRSGIHRAIASQEWQSAIQRLPIIYLVERGYNIPTSSLLNHENLYLSIS
jgi:hypothetical protein